MEDAGRKYLNCRYEPLNANESESQQIALTKKSDYFEGLNKRTKYVLMPAYFMLLVPSHMKYVKRPYHKNSPA